MITDKNFGKELQAGTVAVRMEKTKLGVRKALNGEQAKTAADAFDAAQDVLSARKKLLDTKHPAYRKVTGIQRVATAYWKAYTVPYPITGIRLLNRDKLEEFEARMTVFQQDLQEAVNELQAVYKEMQKAAEEKLGTLYDEHDYNESIVNEFSIAWDFPSLTPPDYLKQLNPDLYEREAQKVAAKFSEAVDIAEQMFATELQDLVTRLTERLSPEPGTGKFKIVKNCLVDGMNEFFVRFKTLNIGSNEKLTELVEAAEMLFNGVDPETLRKSQEMKTTVHTGLSELKEKLDEMLVDAPERAFDFDD